MCERRKENEKFWEYVARWIVDGWTTKPHAVFSLALLIVCGGQTYFFLQHLDKNLEALHEMTTELRELNIRVSNLEHK